MNRSLFIILLPLFFISCASAEVYEPSSEPEQSDISQREIVPLDIKKEPQNNLLEKIIVRDSYSGEEYPLSRIALSPVVYIELSASWCEACPEMKAMTAKLVPYFRGRVFFIRLFKADDPQPEPESNDVPEMVIVSSPPELGLENTGVMPRVVIISNHGEDISLDSTGLYPNLYYYGVLSEI